MQPDEKIDIHRNKIIKQIKLLKSLYYALAIWLVPSYMEFLHVGGMHMPLISVILIGLTLMFLITHRQHLTVTGSDGNPKFILTWFTVFIFNVTVQIFSNTMAYAVMDKGPDFEAGYLFGLISFIAILSYAMSVLIFYEPNHFQK